MDDDDLGAYLHELLGAPACVKLLAVLELPERELATLTGSSTRVTTARLTARIRTG